jgi:hypothetical protein
MTDARWDGFADRATARRAAARSLHPDIGGDSAEFAAALAAIDRRFGLGHGSVAEPIPVSIRQSRRGVMQARLRRVRKLYRQIRTRLPLGRRYLSL